MHVEHPRQGACRHSPGAPRQPQGRTGSPERYLTWAITYSGSVRAGATLTTGLRIAATCLRRGDTIWPGDRGCKNTRVCPILLEHSENTLSEGILFHMCFTLSYFISTYCSYFAHFYLLYFTLVAQMVKNLLQCLRPVFYPWVRKISWRRKWQPTLAFVPGKFHGYSLAGYSPRG